MRSAPRFHIQTFGCQMNVHDSDRIEDALVAHGWLASDDVESADLVIFNTCSVREKAEHKLRSEVGRLRPLKRRRPELVIAVAGCVAQQEGDALLRALPYVDIVVGPDNLAELPLLAEGARMGSPPVTRTEFDLENPTFLAGTTRRPAGGIAAAYVTTMKGCDERCSFCVVPYTRGPERYRSRQEIVDEIHGLVDRGTGEVTLLGQTVNSWIPPNDHGETMDRSQFPELLNAIACEVPGLRRLRYTSPHPRHLTPALIDAHANLDVLAAHVHLPVQSGSNRILRRMIRRYTRAEFIERTLALKAARAGLTLSTDIIVGFPGETEEDFEATLSLVREVGFVALFGFKFSPRPHTPALKLADDVPEAVKASRLAALFATVEQQQRAHLASLVGSHANVLFDGVSKQRTHVSGRSERNEIVHVQVPALREPESLLGRFLDVTIARANAHSLEGTLPESEFGELVNAPGPRRLPLIGAPPPSPP